MKKPKIKFDNSVPETHNKVKSLIVSGIIAKIWQFGIIDTIYFNCPLKGKNIKVKNMTKVLPVSDKVTGEVKGYTGYVNNLKFYWNDKYIFLKEGSLAEFGSIVLREHPVGHNLDLLTRQQMNYLIKILSRKIGIDLIQARISRLDLTIDIPVALLPKDYFAFFEDKPGMHRSLNGVNGLTFVSTDGKYVIYFYNKTKQLKDTKDITVQPDYMRMEIKFLNSTAIKRYMKRMLKKHENEDGDHYYRNIIYSKPFLSIADLLDKNIFTDCIRHIGSEYESIIKKNSSYFDLSLCPKISDVDKQMLIRAIDSSGGINNLLQEFDNSKMKSKPPNPGFLPKLKSRYRKIAANENLTKKFDEIEILDIQIRSIIKCSLLNNYY